MKIRVIRILEYEFENEHTYEEHTSRWTHGMKTNNMSMKSAVLPVRLLDETGAVDIENLRGGGM